MKKLIILIEILIIVLLLNIHLEADQKYFLMTVTFYSRHPKCISDKYNDGYTATMTPIRKGVAAINVDRINGRWIIRSPLKLGSKIYIEGLGNYSVEDTGYFTDKDYKQDFWNVDIYEPDHIKAVKGGRQLKKVYLIEGDK